MSMRDLVPWGRGDRERALAPASEPASPFLSLHRQMNRLFDDVFRDFEMAPAWGRMGSPQVEVEERDGEYRVTAELPGLDERDVEVTVEDGALCLRGEKRAETEDKARAFSERWYGRFERRIALPDVDEATAQASFRNGVLTVTLPKTPAAAARVRKIPVNGGGTSH